MAKSPRRRDRRCQRREHQEPIMKNYRITKLIVCVLAAGALVACGGSGGGKDSPEAVAKALVDAAKAKDPAAVEALFPTEAQLDAALTCEGKGPKEEILRKAKAWAKDIDEIAAEIDSVQSVEPREPEVVKSGEVKKGCTAKMDITVQRAKVIFKTTKGDTDGEGMEFIKLGDSGWYLSD
jgi:hypothetical protein